MVEHSLLYLKYISPEAFFVAYDDRKNDRFREFRKFFKTSNGRLPPEDGSDRRETLGKRVSGDPRHFIFRRPKHFVATKVFVGKDFRQMPKRSKILIKKKSF